MDMSVQFGSMGQPLTAESSTAILTLVLLQGTDADQEKLKQLADGTHPIDSRYLQGGNGYKPRAQAHRLLVEEEKKKPRGLARVNE